MIISTSLEDIKVEFGESDSYQLRKIFRIQVPKWADKFAKKNAEYDAGGASNADVLGVKGQFADIWRKMAKLKTALWDGHPEKLTSEPVEEVIIDLIGHLFLTLDMLERDKPHTVLRDVEIQPADPTMFHPAPDTGPLVNVQAESWEESVIREHHFPKSEPGYDPYAGGVKKPQGEAPYVDKGTLIPGGNGKREGEVEPGVWGNGKFRVPMPVETDQIQCSDYYGFTAEYANRCRGIKGHTHRHINTRMDDWI